MSSDLLNSSSGFGEPALERHDVAVLRAELRDLALLARSMGDAVLLPVAQRCLQRLLGVVHAYGGTVHSLAGNSLLAVFGATPAGPDEHVERSVQCAVELQMAMRDLNAEHRPDRIPELFLGIGVSCGSAVVGWVGAPGVRAAAAMGDVVVLASQLCAFSLRGQVLIGEAVYERTWGLISAASPMPIHVKGRQQPVTVRELAAVPARKLKVPRQEFRRSHRVDVHIPSHLRVVRDGVASAESLEGQILDLGYHGAMMTVSAPVPANVDLRLTFDLALVNYQVREMDARTITSVTDGGQHMIGVEFRTLDAALQDQLRVLVQRLVAAQ